MGTLTLIGGGSRSGKSRYALALAESFGARRVLIATAEARDEEMRARIARHRAERGARFRTVECPFDLPDVVALETEVDAIVIDCLTLWISNLLGASLTNDSILERVELLLAAVAKTSARVIVVSNEVGMGLVSEYELGRRFQDVAGFAHQRLASSAEAVYLATLGCVIRLRPPPLALASPATEDPLR